MLFKCKNTWRSWKSETSVLSVHRRENTEQCIKQLVHIIMLIKSFLAGAKYIYLTYGSNEKKKSAIAQDKISLDTVSPYIFRDGEI